MEELTRPCVEATDVVGCIEQLVLSNPENTELRGLFAYYLVKEGQERRALAEIDKALAFDPDDIESRVFRAQLLRKLGDEEAARTEGELIRELKLAKREKLLTENPEDIGELRVQAHLAEVAGEFETAGRLFERYFELEENPDPLSLSDYAEVLVRLGQFEKALSVMERAFAMDGAQELEIRAALLKARAWIKEQIGDFAGAEEDKNEYEAAKTLVKEGKKGNSNSSP
jgi:Flp pilus assembly protein TadD